MNLSIHIADLLHKNNCVIVPNFGGFIANYQSAVIDELRQKIYPPSKQVLFNKNLISNDGLLANYVAQKVKTTYADALKNINDNVEEWKKDLAEGKRIEIGEIGFLYSDGQQIKFEQNKSYNLLLSAYGLSEIKFITPIEEKVKQPTNKVKEVKPKTIVTKKVSTSKPKLKVVPLQDVVTPVKKIEVEINEAKVVALEPKKRKNNWKYIAVACAIPLLFYSYWIPMNTNVLETGNIKVSDFNPLGHQATKTYQQRDQKFFESISSTESKTWEELTEKINSNVKVYNYQLDDDLYIPVLLTNSNQIVEESPNEIIENQEIETKVEKTEPSIETSTSNHIHLISGCFSDKHNAETFVNELKSKGYQAHIVDKNKGLFRVSAQSFNSKSEAKSFKDKLSNDGYSSWILKK